MNHHTLLASIIGIASPSLIEAAPTNPPDLVYVVCENNYRTAADGDSFNIAANVEAFKGLGYFGPTGEIFRVNANEVKRGDTVVGSVTRDGQMRTLYYSNADDTVRLYPVSSGPSTVNDAWLAVADDGQLLIASHGSRGAMVLDRNKLHKGFKCAGTTGGGTGRDDLDGALPPLELTARTGKVTIDLNGCFTSTDPDDNGPQRSTLASAADLCGVNTTRGNDGIVDKSFNLSMGGPQEKRNEAFAKLDRLAGRRALIASYIAARSLESTLQLGRDLEDEFGIIFKVTSSKTRPPVPNAAPGAPSADTLIASVTTSLFLDEAGPSGALLLYPRLPQATQYSLDLPPGALNTLHAMLLHPAAIESSIWPAGTRPAATACRFGPVPDAELSLNVPATLTISVPRPLAVSGVYRVEGSSLIPLSFTPDTGNSTVTAQVDRAGVYAAFEVPPSCPGDANGDALVDALDLSVLLATFGQSVALGTGADFNADGIVNTADLSLLLASYHQSC